MVRFRGNKTHTHIHIIKKHTHNKKNIALMPLQGRDTCFTGCVGCGLLTALSLSKNCSHLAEGYPSSLGTAYIQRPLSVSKKAWSPSLKLGQFWRAISATEVLMGSTAASEASLYCSPNYPPCELLHARGFRNYSLGSLTSDHLKADYVAPLLKIFCLQTAALTP